MKALRSFLSISAVAVLLSAGAVRAADENPFKFEFHGFITGSIYAQSQVFSGAGGQGLLFYAPTPGTAAPCKAITCPGPTPTQPPAPAPAVPPTATKSDTFLGGDARQSRFIFALTGPQGSALGGTPRAYFEGDLFGTSGGAPLVESWGWRIRAAYAENKWGNFVFQAGQHSAHLAFAQMPDSVSHIANPISFGAGNFGWRTLDARGIYTVPMGDNKVTLSVMVAQPSWFNNNVPGAAVAPPGQGATPLASIGSGEKGGIPMFEAQGRVDGKSGGLGYSLYLDGLYQTVDLKGFGGATAPNGVTLADGTSKTSATSYAAELGGKLGFSPVYVAFNVYTGKGLGSMAGNLLQGGEIAETAFWVGAGANLTKEFSLNATYGMAMEDEKDVRKWAAVYGPSAGNQRKDNTMYQAQAKLLDGGYAFAVEYIYYKTTYLQGSYAQKYVTSNAPANIKTDGWQIIGTAGYFF